MNNLDKKEIIRITQDLIKIPSITGDFKQQRRVVAYIKKYFKNSNLYIKEIKINGFFSLIISNRKNSKKFKFALLGHTDVVPDDKRGFVPRIKNGKIHGRGSADMKGAVAVMMYFMRIMAIRKSFGNDPVALFIVNDEETGGRNGARYLVESGYSSDLMFVPDGGNDLKYLINETRGILQLKASAHSQGGHAASFGIDNPIDKILDFYIRTKKELENSHKRFNISLNAGKINGGESINQIPKKVEIFLDVRFAYSRSNNVQDIIRRKVEKFAKKENIEIVYLSDADPMKVNPNHRLLKLYKKTAEKVLGQEIIVRSQGGTHDGRYFANKGIPIIVTRPKSDGLHSEKEWVDIKSLCDSFDILDEFWKNYVQA